MDEPQIGNVNEGIVEGVEYAGNAENELACSIHLVRPMIPTKIAGFVKHTVTGEGAEGDILLGGGGSLLGSHCDSGWLSWME